MDSEHAGYAVALEFDSDGADLFYQATQAAYNGEVTSTIEGVPDDSIVIILDGQIISYPQVNEPISGGQCSITHGNFGNVTEVDNTRQVKSSESFFS